MDSWLRKGLDSDVRKRSLLLFALLVWVGFDCGAAWACRYNVLEVGFIDLGIEPYYLFGYVGDETPAASVAALQEEVEAALIDTNIVFEVVGAGGDPNHPAASYLRGHEITKLPAVVLVSPDGQSMQVPLERAEDSLVKAFLARVEGILISTKRAEILARSAETYGIVLLIEGPDEAANAKAREAADAAVAQIAEQMDMMPKPIANPPEVVTLPAKSLADEQLLLWSLDVKPEDVNAPHAAVIYSRGRWIGPMFRGDQITPENLADVLYVIGADCECGLDHRWLQGTMLPARWNGRLQAATAENLGFDPESPMVKMEMVSIIRRGMGGFSYPGVPMGYREIEVEEVESESVESTDSAESFESIEAGESTAPDDAREHSSVPVIPEEVSSGSDANEPVPGNAETMAVPSPMPVLAWVTGGLAVCVVVTGVAVFVRARKV
ncbi:MAG: hypothetical protein ACYTAS_13805 [Planctomycetota bacterium]